MKVVIIGGVMLGVTVVIVVSLGSAMQGGDYPDFDAGVTGPLGRGAVSRALHPVLLWTKPRGTTSQTEREEMYVGTVGGGETFEVLNHFRNGPQFWVLVRKKSDTDCEGWFHSPTADPVRAEQLNR